MRGPAWYDPQDHTAPVIEAKAHARSKFSSGETPVLPCRAMVFCLGKGLPVLEREFPTEMLLEELPGFITHSPVLGVKGNPGICFLNGGYGSPQIACTVETLHALGVEEIFLVGLCGGFSKDCQVGDVFVPEKIWSEEGITFHYRETGGFVALPAHPREEWASWLGDCGFPLRQEATVTTDGVYRQTLHKEALWRQLGCGGVDMEASALVSVCSYYRMGCSVALLVSDRHPVEAGDAPWKWGNQQFPQLRDKFLTCCIQWALNQEGRK